MEENSFESLRKKKKEFDGQKQIILRYVFSGELTDKIGTIILIGSLMLEQQQFLGCQNSVDGRPRIAGRLHDMQDEESNWK